MMRDLLSPDDLIAQILLMRDIDRRVLLLVESESDCTLIDCHRIESAMETLPAYGRDAVLTVARAARDLGIERIIALVDRDLTGPAEDSPPDVFYTEEIDIEMEMLSVPGVYERVMRGATGAKRLTSSDVEILKSRAYELASPIGHIRARSMDLALEVNMRDFPVRVAVDRSIRHGCPYVEAVVDLAISRSTASRATREQLLALCAERPYLGSPSGHDISASLAQALREIRNIEIAGRFLEAFIRSTMGCSEFRVLPFVREMALWANGNSVELWDCTSAYS